MRSQGAGFVAHRLRGVDAVVTTANAIGRGGEDTIESVDLRGNQHLISGSSPAGELGAALAALVGALAALVRLG